MRKQCSLSTVAGWERSARLALPCLSCSCVRCVDTFDSCDLARVASLFLSSLRSFFFVFSVPSYAHFISRSSIFNPFNNLETPRQYPASQVRRTVLGFNLSDASKINRAGILTRPDKCHPKAPQPWVVVPVSVWGAHEKKIGSMHAKGPGVFAWCSLFFSSFFLYTLFGLSSFSSLTRQNCAIQQTSVVW